MNANSTPDDKNDRVSAFYQNKITLFFIIAKGKHQSEIAPGDFVRQKYRQEPALLAWLGEDEAEHYLVNEIAGIAYMRVQEFQFADIKDIYYHSGIDSAPIVKLMGQQTR